jgi:hypothetical protein
MKADRATQEEILQLVRETYAQLSTPGGKAAELMSHPDMTVAGSGLGELAYSPEVVAQMANGVSSFGYLWEPETVATWQEGNVAWAQILGTVHVRRDDVEDHVPYWTTAVFAKDGQGWQWRYWGDQSHSSRRRCESYREEVHGSASLDLVHMSICRSGRNTICPNTCRICSEPLSQSLRHCDDVNARVAL